MAFDSTKFLNTEYRDRTEDVPVPELKKYFDDDETPVWTVRCLTASEIGRANDEVSMNADVAAIVSKLASSMAKDKADAINEMICLDPDKVPNDIVKRISQLMSGSVNPKCSREFAVKIGQDHGVTFYKLTNRILELSGKGRLGE